MKWVQIIVTLLAGMSITLSWPEWLSLVLTMTSCLIWGIAGYSDGLTDGGKNK